MNGAADVKGKHSRYNQIPDGGLESLPSLSGEGAGSLQLKMRPKQSLIRKYNVEISLCLREFIKQGSVPTNANPIQYAQSSEKG